MGAYGAPACGVPAAGIAVHPGIAMAELRTRVAAATEGQPPAERAPPNALPAAEFITVVCILFLLDLVPTLLAEGLGLTTGVERCGLCI